MATPPQNIVTQPWTPSTMPVAPTGAPYSPPPSQVGTATSPLSTYPAPASPNPPPTVTIKQVQVQNQIQFATNQAVLTGPWKAVRSSGFKYCCGVTVGYMNQKIISTVGRTVIPAYCPPPAPPSPQQLSGGPVIQQAVTAALNTAPQITVQSGQLQHPGFRGVRKTLTQSFIITDGTTSQADSALMLQWADGGVNGPAIVEFPQFFVNPQEIVPALPYPSSVMYRYTVPSSAVVQVDSITLSVDDWDAANELWFSIWVSGKMLQSYFRILDQTEIMIEVPVNADEVIQIMVANTNTTSAAHFVKMTLNLWQNPTVSKTDSDYSRQLRQSPSYPNPGCP